VFYNDMSHTANQLATQAERLLAERRAERSSILMSSDTIPASLTPLLASLPPVKSAPASRSAQRRTARSPSILETEDEAEEDIEDEENEEDDEDELAL